MFKKTPIPTKSGTAGHLDYIFDHLNDDQEKLMNSGSAGNNTAKKKKKEPKTFLEAYNNVGDKSAVFRSRQEKQRAEKVKLKKFPQYRGSTIGNTPQLDIVLPASLPKRDAKQEKTHTAIVAKNTVLDRNVEKLNTKIENYNRIYGESDIPTTEEEEENKKKKTAQSGNGVFGGLFKRREKTKFTPGVPKPVYVSKGIEEREEALGAGDDVEDVENVENVESVGEDVEDAGEDVGEDVENVGEDVENVGEDVEDAGEDVGDDVEDAEDAGGDVGEGVGAVVGAVSGVALGDVVGQGIETTGGQAKEEDVQKEEVDGDVEEEVDGDVEEEVDGDVEEEVDGDVEEEVDGDVEEEVDGDVEEEVDGDVEEEVDGDVEEEVDGDVEENPYDDTFYIPKKDAKEIRRTHDNGIALVNSQLNRFPGQYTKREENNDYKLLMAKHALLDSTEADMAALVGAQTTLEQKLKVSKNLKDKEWERVNALNLKAHKLAKLEKSKRHLKREKKRKIIGEKLAKRTEFNNKIQSENEATASRNQSIENSNNLTRSINAERLQKNKEFAQIKQERAVKYPETHSYVPKPEFTSPEESYVEQETHEEPEEQGEEDHDNHSEATSFVPSEVSSDDEQADVEDNEDQIEQEFKDVSDVPYFTEEDKQEYRENKKELDSNRLKLNKKLGTFNSLQNDILGILSKPQAAAGAAAGAGAAGAEKPNKLPTLNTIGDYNQSSGSDLDKLSDLDESSEVDEDIPPKLQLISVVPKVKEINLDSEPEPSPIPTREPTPEPQPEELEEKEEEGPFGDHAATAQVITAPAAGLGENPASDVFTPTTIKSPSEFKDAEIPHSAEKALDSSKDVANAADNSSLFSDYTQEEIITVADE